MDFFNMVERLRLEVADVAADEIQVETYSIGYRTTISFFEMCELVVAEAVDIAPDSGEIEIVNKGQNYEAPIRHMGEEFLVVFKKRTETPSFAKSAEGNPVVDKLHGYEISLLARGSAMGPGKAGGEAFMIYSKLLLAVKKFLEMMERDKPNEIEFVKFIGVTDMMNILYDLFHRKFLADRYIRVGFTTFLRKDVLERIHFLTGGASKERVAMAQSIAKDQLADAKKADLDAKRIRAQAKGLAAPS